MKLDRQTLRKLILQELTLRGGKWRAGDTPEQSSRRLRSPLANLPALDLDDKTELMDDSTTELDWNRQADSPYVADPSEPEGWGEFWDVDAPTEKVEPSWQPTPTRRQDLRARKQDYLALPDMEQDTEVETEEWQNYPEEGLRSVQTGEGEILSPHVRHDVGQKADKLTLTKEQLRRMITKQLSEILRH